MSEYTVLVHRAYLNHWKTKRDEYYAVWGMARGQLRVSYPCGRRPQPIWPPKHVDYDERYGSWRYTFQLAPPDLLRQGGSGH